MATLAGNVVISRWNGGMKTDEDWWFKDEKNLGLVGKLWGRKWKFTHGLDCPLQKNPPDPDQKNLRVSSQGHVNQQW